MIQPTVQFAKLGLIVIDEQHRFGVAQRLALSSKAESHGSAVTKVLPHQISLTATPIPRTLAMTLYADLDVSSIDELPSGRKPIETVAMSISQKREAVIERVHAACGEGKQAYWVCPLIDQSEVIQVQA